MNRFSAADATLDTDQDGNNARAEYLFGLNPATSDRFGWTTTRHPSTVDVAFPTLPQRTYRVFSSTDLTTWTQDIGATQNITTTADNVQTVSVTLSPALLSSGTRFVRVQAVVP